MMTDTIKIGDAVQVFSDYHGYSYVANVHDAVLVAQDETSFTVRYTTGGNERTERFTNLDNYHLQPVEPKVTVHRCIECGLEMDGATCKWCGGF